MADGAPNLSEDEQSDLIAFFQETQSLYLPMLGDFHDRLSAVPGISEDVIREYTRIYKLIKMGWEQTANNLQGDE